MKLLIVVALIATTSAGRLENLQRSYLPPDNNIIQGGIGTNGFGANTGTPNGFGKGNFGNGFNNGFGANGRASNGFAVPSQGPNGNGVFSQSVTGTYSLGSNGAAIGANAFGTGAAGGRNGAFAGAASTQYLPPNQGSAGAGVNGFNFGRSSIKPACSTCGSSRFGSQQINQGQASIPAATYGVPQFGAAISTPNGSAISGVPTDADAPSQSLLGAPAGNFGPGPQGVNRQYLAPNPTPQNPPQQPFDDRAGYIY